MSKAKDKEADDYKEFRDPLGRFMDGNKYAHLKGEFQSPEELQKAAEEYIQTTKMKTTGAYKPTITGLVFHLGFADLRSFYDYEKREPYTQTIKRLRLFIQSCYEQNLYGFAWAGAFAALRNIGRNDWKDEITENQNTIITNVNPNVQSSTTPLSNSESEVKP
jgi:hypothetical protein